MLDVARAQRGGEPGLLPGELLADKYRIERVLGQGGMGVVLGARNVLLGKRVAVKIVARGAGGVATVRLLMEARAAARLESDHSVRIFDVGHTEQGDPYLVMEHLEGRSLAELARERVTREQAVLWMLQACEALAEAHSHGIVHRDIKPANLFLEERPDGSRRIKVLDFGIAKLPAAERLTTTTHPLGSPVYMAPEQLANDADVDARADVWGIGCVLYELLVGRAPFEAGCVLELAAKVARGSYRRLRSLRPDVPEELSRVVDRCLEADRARRFRDLRELGRALAPFGPGAAVPLLARIERLQARAGASADACGDAGEATRDLPNASLAHGLTTPMSEHDARQDALRESIPALESSLRAAPPVSPHRSSLAPRRTSLAALSAVAVIVLAFAMHSRISATPAAPLHASAARSAEARTEPTSASAAPIAPAAREAPRALTPSSTAQTAAQDIPAKPRARRGPPRAARPLSRTSAPGELTRSSARSLSAPDSAEPLPIDRDAPW